MDEDLIRRRGCNVETWDPNEGTFNAKISSFICSCCPKLKLCPGAAI